MDQMCHLLMCVLISTGYASTEYKVLCPDQHGTVGKPLTLTCTVLCYKNNCKFQMYKWKKNNETLSNVTSNFTSSCTEEKENYSKNITCNYTIQKTSKKHNGSITFWVQLTDDYMSSNLALNLSEDLTPHPTTEDVPDRSRQDGMVPENVSRTRLLLSLVFIAAVCLGIYLLQKHKTVGKVLKFVNCWTDNKI